MLLEFHKCQVPSKRNTRSLMFESMYGGREGVGGANREEGKLICRRIEGTMNEAREGESVFDFNELTQVIWMRREAAAGR